MSRSCASGNAELALDMPCREAVDAERTAAPSADAPQEKLKVKAAVNDWMSANLDEIRTQLALGTPSQIRLAPPRWLVPLVFKQGRSVHAIGNVHLDGQLHVVQAPERQDIEDGVQRARNRQDTGGGLTVRLSSSDYGLFYGDGIQGTAKLHEKSVDLLLTDPPYSISSAYTCEKQIPRRLRANGGDFIMPKGDFGAWDKDFSPKAWTDVVLPKIRGWAVVFCAQAQIGDYVEILRSHGFNAVGTIVCTRPTPFRSTRDSSRSTLGKLALSASVLVPSSTAMAQFTTSSHTSRRRLSTESTPRRSPWGCFGS